MSPLALRLYKALLSIPRGKVATYATLAKHLDTSPRAIASMLAANREANIYPCYKVVHTDGRLGGYGYGNGVPEKIRRLEADGIEIRDGRVDLERFGFRGF